MRRLLTITALCLVPALLLSGCWSYRSLSDIAIVMGIALDKNPDNGNYRMSSEIVDLTKAIKDSAPGSAIVQSEGRTLFDALRNAKKRLLNRLYFGNMQIMVISEEVARTEGISNAVDWVMRDSEGRETINLVISQGSEAGKLLSTKGTDQSIASLEIDSVITEDDKVTSSTAHVELYNVYDILNGSGKSLTLPAFHITTNTDRQTVEANGVAAFKGDKLVGFLSPEETKFFLIATNAAHGGILALALKGAGVPDTSLEIAGSKSHVSFFYRGGQLTFRIETETDVYLAETMADIDVLDEKQIKALEDEAGRRMELEIESLVKMVQTDLKTDIFGFGHVIHMYDYALWKQLEPSWDSMFEALQVEASSKVNIKNTAFIKSKEAIPK